MPGKIYRYLADDHARLESLLQSATMRPDSIDPKPYAAFRAGLLKHIAMEEKILLPAAQRMRGGEPLTLAAKLRLDHGALAALLVPTPTLSRPSARSSKPTTPSKKARTASMLSASNWQELKPTGF
ncbi:MAG: hemerythrin domain-containing protein [Deltaproteobacteria bacterium]|nr:hemerythrin domain-containing protein [Deltaproteobacteria bacterium]